MAVFLSVGSSLRLLHVLNSHRRWRNVLHLFSPSVFPGLVAVAVVAGIVAVSPFREPSVLVGRVAAVAPQRPKSPAFHTRARPPRVLEYYVVDSDETLEAARSQITANELLGRALGDTRRYAGMIIDERDEASRFLLYLLEDDHRRYQLGPDPRLIDFRSASLFGSRAAAR